MQVYTRLIRPTDLYGILLIDPKPFVQASGVETWVAIDKHNVLLGYVSVELDPREPRIIRLFVGEAFRKQCVGSTLIELVKFKYTQHREPLVAQVPEDETAGFDFLDSHGFTYSDVDSITDLSGTVVYEYRFDSARFGRNRVAKFFKRTR